jgi:hypothetical protein
MPHFTPAGSSGLAHGLVWARLRQGGDPQRAIAGIKSKTVPKDFTREAISHLEDPNAGGATRPPGNIIATFLNSTLPLRDDVAHQRMEQYAADIGTVPDLLPNPDHY